MIRLRVVPPLGDAFEHVCQGDELVIGRSSKADLVIADRFLSRQHARLYREGDEWRIEDLGSRNTTLLNGRPVTTPTFLTPGDVLKLSESVVSVEAIGDVADAGSTPLPGDSAIYRAADDLLSDRVATADLDNAIVLRRYSERLRLVNEVHRALSTSVSLDELLELILDRVFAHLQPEEAVIFLKDRKGDYRRAASRRLPGLAGDFPYSRSLIAEVAEKKLAALVLDARTDERFSTAQSILSSGVRSLVAAPLLEPSGCPGLIVLSSRAHVRRFAEEDMELLVSLAGAAALRIRNIALTEEAVGRRQLEKEMTLAREIQVALLPQSLPKLEGYALHAVNQPSRAVSGDFYDIQTRADGRECIIFIADVSGKGMGASLLAASLDAMLMGPIEVGDPPDIMCAKLSRRLFLRTPPERYATAMVAILDASTGHLSWANAGHNPGLLLRAGGAVERLDATGVPLGLVPKVDYTRVETQLEPGDLLVLYTDGISEAAAPDGEEYGLDRLQALLRGQSSRPPAELARALQTDLDAFAAGTPFGDDRTLVLLQRQS